MKEKRICRKTARLLSKLANMRNDLIMVSCNYFDAEEVGYNGKITYKYRFSVSLINSEKHVVETEKFNGRINENEIKSLPVLLACEWYYRKGRDLYAELTFSKN